MDTKIFLTVLLSFFLIVSCNSYSDEEQVARKYCSTCHIFPDPSLLDTITWEKGVLPVMARQLGISYFGNEPYQNTILNRNNSSAAPITVNDWKKIIKYYSEAAPSQLPPQNRPPIQNFTNLFTVKKGGALTDKFPSVTYLKIDESNHWIYTGNAADSSLIIYDGQLKEISHFDIHGVMVDMQLDSSSKNTEEQKGVLTNIGIMNPNDLKTGTADTFRINRNGVISSFGKILDNMPRPVQTTMADLDKDGKEDLIVCGFGHTTGALYWMKNENNKEFQQKMIRPLPGAIKVYIDDYNKDGLPDIMALMAQAQEGVYLFTNKGNGEFETKNLLQFPPVYGSSYFELDDFNHDGYKDILYTCGDNADYSSHELKNFHGVYIFLNNGKDVFTQKYFFPIHGCYKAMAKDFDGDGDLDIACISYFPDKKNQPKESFVYLENRGSYQFSPYTIKEFNEGDWLTMDAGDIDGDGDEDIVLGSFVLPGKNSQSLQDLSQRPSFLLLQNNTKNK